MVEWSQKNLNEWLDIAHRQGAFHFKRSSVKAMKIATFYTSLTDAQWAFLKRLLPKRRKRGRPPTDRRRIMDAVLYVVKGGIQWRLLPLNFPPWQTVYHIFRQWTLDHTWAALNDRLRAHVRKAQGKRSRPTAATPPSASR